MCSLKLPETMGGAGEEAVFSAVVDVAERSFFSIVDPCDERKFEELAAPHAHWLTATVNFDEGEWAGAVTCHLPAPLAERMCDAFVGREPDNMAPEHEHVIDLVGEFTNMICGAWLTRAANNQTFALSTPIVVTTVDPTAATDARVGMLLAIDDLPCSVDIQFFVVPALTSERG